ncbi:putative F-box domain, leucine-rich repeat domain superfamily, F-box-like domain superfamily [Helianthus annuus]|uniref:F-box domain, leucine-rich repeat domain superfamily, F-box-like domain superfamily n=2 Tax=Helianthus annuus TaxID=4232 RepID=A0A251RSH1_HELAN|nr:F-box/LRR-repeat protein 10 isoform X1 [Helianthus annuus]KAF5754687.1 putative F-box domain, leucine-rich repeat domain superfamily, F-box-like domain superfamily [Helianthus annuus]KAJ0432642.1 putative F-box domain, leucine-rich repeat domain superfamily, F-box-like domain superfamily [Helianthus annuus]KAJ0635677.1 putative F-box domain, leucine-rich repeat domain superfamily, F-box-like domain superfamily [Helianthus annuus]KAJ0812448.1 putative F-box domain, leucine-rich repeat domain 
MAESSNRRHKFNHNSPPADEITGEMTLDRLSSEVLATIMTKLDVSSICAITLTCKSFRICAQDIFKFIPNFHLLEIAAPIDRLRRLLLPNASLRSLKLDCRRLNESSIDCILQPGLVELTLRNCYKFSGKLLSEVGARCKDLRSLYVSSVADNRAHIHDVCDLEELLRGCTQLEELVLMFDASIFRRPDFARVWTLASTKLIYLQIGYITQLMVIELLSPTVAPNQSPNHILPHVFPNIHKLCLSVDYISNTMVNIISNTLIHLTHLDLRDQPVIEPGLAFDLTDEGLQLINQHGRLKHLSLIRSQEFNPTFFRRVTDQGILFMADRCTNMESICLAGFCQVTDTGFKTLLHACTNLYKLNIFNGTRMTDLVFHDMYATSLALTFVSLRCCNLLTNSAVLQLALNMDLTVLDFRDSRNIGDKALQAVSKLPKLRTLLLDGTDVTDLGLSYLQRGAESSLVKLSIRGCKRLTCKCVSSIFNGGSNRELRELDLSNLPNLTNGGVLFLAKNRIPLVDLRMRQCPLIGDTSVMALASMTMADGDRWHGSSLRSLDLYNCGGISKLAFQWLKKPYFPGLRWLGVAASLHHELVDSLAINRPFLNLMTRGEELGTDKWDNLDDIYMHDYEEVDELEQWIFQEDENMTDDDDDDNDNDNDVDDDVEAGNEE